MAYLFLSTDAQDDATMLALYSREKEDSNYALNASNYTTILASSALQQLPAVWPSNLTQYRSVFGEQLAGMVIAGTLAQSDYQTVCLLQFRDRVTTLLQTTMSEQTKGQAVYSALTQQISDPARFAAASKRLREKIAAGTV